MYENLVITELPNSEIEISADIPLLQVQVHRAHVIKELNDSATIAGFRSGHIPEEILIRHVGEAPLMEKVGEAVAALLGGTDAQGEVHSTLAKQALYFKARSAECLEKLECWKRWKGYNDPADWWKS